MNRGAPADRRTPGIHAHIRQWVGRSQGGGWDDPLHLTKWASRPGVRAFPPGLMRTVPVPLPHLHTPTVDVTPDQHNEVEESQLSH
jgi:hypothetical protein